MSNIGLSELNCPIGYATLTFFNLYAPSGFAARKIIQHYVNGHLKTRRFIIDKLCKFTLPTYLQPNATAKIIEQAVAFVVGVSEY